MGVGKRAAILVVDLQRAFTDETYTMGRSPHVQRAVEKTAALLDLARPLGVPVASCSVGWYSERDMPRWKVDAVYEGLFYGDAGMDIDQRIAHPTQGCIDANPRIFSDFLKTHVLVNTH